MDKVLLSDEEMIDCLLPLIEASGDVISFKEQKKAIAKAQLRKCIEWLEQAFVKQTFEIKSGERLVSWSISDEDWQALKQEVSE